MSPLSRCQANCRGKKLEWVTIQRGVNILDDDVDLKDVTYSWSFKREDGSAFVDLTDQLSGTGKFHCKHQCIVILKGQYFAFYSQGGLS